MTPDEAHQITMKFTEEAFRTLQGLANERGQSVGDVMSDALALQRWGGPGTGEWERGCGRSRRQGASGEAQRAFRRLSRPVLRSSQRASR